MNITKLRRALSNFLRYTAALGPLEGLLTYSKLRTGAVGIVEVRSPGINVRTQLRKRTVDVGVWDEVFMLHEYLFPEILHPPKRIIDAGAHIGLASLYFATQYRDAEIISLEPDPENFAILRQNASAHPQIRPRHAALWSQPGQISFSSGSGQSVSGSCIGPHESGQTVDATTIPILMEELDWESIDLLKIDIEGAEAEVFAHAGAWIDRVRNIVIEFHDRKVAGCTTTFRTAVADCGFRETVRGQNHLYTRDKR